MIESERLILRPFKKGDEKDLFEYLKNPPVNCFLDMKKETLEDTLKEVLERAKDPLYFAIILKDENKLIGEINALKEAICPKESNSDSLTYSICWMLNKKYQGKGYAYEAACTFFNYLFNELNARRLFAYVEDYNISSQNLCIRLGMRKEGEFKEYVSFINDKNGNPIYENTWQYAILKNEWDNIEK